ncbi:hypothetical protein BA177_01355 [Woeseia oceani]|uniref:Competence protein n=2 Tax=Woeseia oceani TaxID=1548547 RepID=A0A193LC14_9GAMM|nr:hypothetical protein BA177_01355 [Woeseia oceani]
MNHWAHKGRRHCDPWWENETLWHREWKGHFPAEWQEICLNDADTGERHIADVRAENGIVVEFQHSFMRREEMVAREAFYKNMVWVVDGTRLKTDKARFLKNGRHLNDIWRGLIFLTQFPEETFNKNWVGRSKPVFFDFAGLSENIPEGKGKLLWCLLPGAVSRGSIVLSIKQSDFVERVKAGDLMDFIGEVYRYGQSHNQLITQRAINREKEWLAMKYSRRKPGRLRRRRRL